MEATKSGNPGTPPRNFKPAAKYSPMSRDEDDFDHDGLSDRSLSPYRGSRFFGQGRVADLGSDGSEEEEKKESELDPSIGKIIEQS